MQETSHIDSYYSRTLGNDRVRPPLKGAIEADVCIVGGGLAGLAAAIGLAERGKKVAILEGRRVGWGASGRNGGFVLAGYAAGAKSIVKKVGLLHARALYDLTRRAQSLIRKRIVDYGIACDPIDGHLRVSWFDDPDAFREETDWLNKHMGANAEFWPQEKVRDVCRTGRYYNGQYFPDYFHMHPLNYLQSLAIAIEAKGGLIFESSMAVKTEKNGADHVVHTNSGSVRATDVVLCGSAYFNGLERRLQNACLPVSTYVMATDPVPPDALRKAIACPYAIRDNRWSDDYYRILPDNSILWGGRVGLGHTVPNNLPELMLRDLLLVYPQLEGTVRVKTTWAGIMGYTTHKMPHIGKLEPGLWACTNFGGNGLGPTTAGGEAIADAITGNDNACKLFEPFLRFNWTGGILGPLIAQSVYHSWEIRDRAQEWRSAQRQKAASR